MKEAPKNISIALGIIVTAYVGGMAKSRLLDVLYGAGTIQTFDATPTGFNNEPHDKENGNDSL